MVLPSAKTLRLASVAAALVLALATTTTTVSAQEREGNFDLFVIGQFAVGDDTSALDGVVDIEFEDTFAGGFGFGHNLNDYINVNATLLIGPAEVEASAFGVTVDDDATLIAPDVNIDWNILPNDVTPFVTAGIGAMIFTGGEDDETDFSYGAGAGVRWDFGEGAFMKVWYRAKWFEPEDVDDDLLTHTFNIAIGITR